MCTAARLEVTKSGCAAMALRRIALALLIPLHVMNMRLAVGAAPAGVRVASFEELEEAVESSESAAISITSGRMTFPHQLHIFGDKVVSIDSTDGALLSGGNVTRFFVVDASSSLSLRNLHLADGGGDGCETVLGGYVADGSHGGAIVMNPKSVLIMNSVRLSTARASIGGAIFASSANVTAVDCTMESNSALTGGVLYANDRSIITMTGCTMRGNDAKTIGGSICVRSNSTVDLANCSMGSNSAYLSGGAIFVSGRCIVSASDCQLVSNKAATGAAIMPPVSMPGGGGWGGLTSNVQTAMGSWNSGLFYSHRTRTLA